MNPKQKFDREGRPYILEDGSINPYFGTDPGTEQRVAGPEYMVRKGRVQREGRPPSLSPYASSPGRPGLDLLMDPMLAGSGQKHPDWYKEGIAPSRPLQAAKRRSRKTNTRKGGEGGSFAGDIGKGIGRAFAAFFSAFGDRER